MSLGTQAPAWPSAIEVDAEPSAHELAARGLAARGSRPGVVVGSWAGLWADLWARLREALAYLVPGERRTSIGVAILMVAALAAAVVLQIRREHVQALEAAEARVGELSVAYAAGTSQSLSRIRRIAEVAGHAVSTRGEEGIDAVATLTALDPSVTQMIVIDQDGLVRASARGRPAGPRSFSNTTFFARARDPVQEGGVQEGVVQEVGVSASFIAPFSDAEFGGSPLSLYVRLDDAAGQFAGVVIVTLKPDVFSGVHAGSGDHALRADLIDPFNRVLVSVGDSALAPGQALGIDLSRTPAGMAADIRYGSGGSGGSGTRLVAVVRIPGIDGFVAVSKPVSDALAPWFGSLPLYLLIILGPCVLAAMMASALLRQFADAEGARLQSRQTRDRYEAALANVHAGLIHFIPRTGRFVLGQSLAMTLAQTPAPGGYDEGSLYRLVHPDDHQALERLTSSLRRNMSGEAIDLRFAHPEGRWLSMRVTLAGVAGRRLIGVATEVELRGDADVRIRAAEERLRDALENAPQGYVLFDRQGHLTLANRRYGELWSLSPEAVAPGMSESDILEARDATGESELRIERFPLGVERNDMLDELVHTGVRWLHVATRRTRDGGRLAVSTDVTVLKDQEEEIIRGKTALKDVLGHLESSRALLAAQAGELTTLTQRVEAERKRAEEASRAKSEFLANMSHELRTPLNAILGFSEIMHSELYGPIGHVKYGEYVCDVIASGNGLLETINDILDMSTIESHQMELNVEAFDIGPMVDETLRLVEARAYERHVTLSHDCARLPKGMGDRRAIKQVLLNLLSNAVKFTEPGGQALVRATPEADGILISVIDTGLGIAAEDIPRLGQPFTQVENQHSKRTRGMGLGLAVSRALIELHGAKLAIRSALGRGTTVSFLLPYAGNTAPLAHG